MCTRQSHDQYTVSDNVAVESTFAATSMASRVILSNFFEKQELITTHNTFRDTRVHFFPQPFLK